MMMTGTQPKHPMELEIPANWGGSSSKQKKAKMTEESMAEC